MENLVLEAERRDLIGKKVKVLRRQGLLPAILYGRGIEPIPIQMDELEAERTLSKASGSTLIDLAIDGETHKVIVRDAQFDSIYLNLLHVDFLKVAMDVAIRTTVPLELVGEAPAVDEYGGILVTSLTEMDIEALPADLPDRISVSVDGLAEIDDAVFVGDLDIGEGITVLTDPEEVIAHVVYQEFEEEEEEEEEEVLVDLQAEPELVERGKREEEPFEEDLEEAE
jgi:large subunit ribosomal protein L25